MKELLQQALDALEPISAYGRPGSRDVEQAVAQKAITALRQALAQPESEPAPESQRQEAYDSIDRLLRNHLDDDDYACFLETLDTLYAGAQQVAVPQEPVAWVGEISEDSTLMLDKPNWPAIALYKAPQPAAYVPLTNEDAIRSAIERHMADFPANCKNAAVEVVHAVLAHKGEMK